MTIEHPRFVARLAQQPLRIGEFQRQMRLAAAEIDAAVERPGRIDQRDAHAQASSLADATPLRPVESPNHFTGPCGPSCSRARGRRPAVAVNPDRETSYRRLPGRAPATAASVLMRALYRRRHQPPLSPT